MAAITTLEQLRAIIPAPSDTAFAKIRPELCEQALAFVSGCSFATLGTSGPEGLELSQKGGPPGFILAPDRQTLLIPEFAGNQFALALGNIVRHGQVALALLRPGTDEVLRVSGRAELEDDAALCARLGEGGKPAKLVIRVFVVRAAFHCVRSARRAGLWSPAAWPARMRISFGQIYAEALARPEVAAVFDDMTDASNATLY